MEPMSRMEHTFALEDGAVRMARHFFAVERFDLPSAFIFPSTQPVLDYINSTRALREPQLPRRIAWDDFIGVLSEQNDPLINHFGQLIVNQLTEHPVATHSRLFAHDYIETTN